MVPKRSLYPLLIALAVGVVVAVAGCTKLDNQPPPPPYHERILPQDVLYNLQKCYTLRDIEEYGQLLAEDFHFWFDPETQVKRQLPENWDKFQDSTGTALSIFKSDKISDIRITLNYGQPDSVNELGREKWMKIIAYANLDVDQKPDLTQPEGITYQVQNQPSLFYFRRGMTPGDTLSRGRPLKTDTSRWFYITEWKDQGTVPH